MKLGKKYIQYIGSIYRVSIYIETFKCISGIYSGITASLIFNIKVNNSVEGTVTVNYDDSNESEIYYDTLITPIKVKPNDKVEIEMVENYPSDTDFLVDNVEVKIKCSKIPY